MKKSFKKGDRVFREGKGFGTVAQDTYNGFRAMDENKSIYAGGNIEFTTYTPVKWDDYLGQKLALSEDTLKLELVTQ